MEKRYNIRKLYLNRISELKEFISNNEIKINSGDNSLIPLNEKYHHEIKILSEELGPRFTYDGVSRHG